MIVTGFVLVQADTNMDLRTVEDGDVLNIQEGSRLSLRANTEGPVESVVFDWDGTVLFRVEEDEPYTLGGDTNGDYASVTDLALAGLHTVTASPYSGAGGSNRSGQAKTIVFLVVIVP